MKKILNSGKLIKILKSKNKKIALSHGVFDLLHHGHLRHFEEIKKQCDILIVSLTSDRFVKKGFARPYFALKDRVYALSQLQSIDYIIESKSFSSVNVIKKIKPDLYCKGPDYKNLNEDRTKKIFLEKEMVEKYGGRLIFTSSETSSSSKLINSEFIFNKDQLEFLRKINKKISTSAIENFLDKINKDEINVIGESIIDSYTELHALNKSGKESILNFLERKKYSYLGGTLAVCNNISNFVKKVRLITYIGDKRDYKSFIKKNLNKNVEFFVVKKKNSPTIFKQRFLDQYSTKKIIGIYDLNDEDLDKNSEKIILKKISKLKKGSLALIFDYGHGFFTKKISKSINLKKNIFKSINSQLNSSSIGSHNLKKFTESFLITLNETELRHEMRNKNLPIKDLIKEFSKNINSQFILVTMGKNGSYLIDNKKKKFIFCPGFANSIVDKTGAGDSMIPILSIALRNKLDVELSLFLASVFASETIRHVANKSFMTRENLLDITQTMLKV